MHIIYVDDEQPALDNFRLTVAGLPGIDSLHLFLNGEAALGWISEHMVDAAFLDMEMPGIHGLELARKIKELNVNIRIIFVTAYREYAMEAWNVDATGYVLKPYTSGDIEKELRKCTYHPLPSQRIVIHTIPNLTVTVDGIPLHLGRAKVRELFALLVDRGERGITSGEGIAYLWPDRPNDSNTLALLRVTYKRLADALEEAGIGHIITSKGNRRFLRVEQVDCDLYRILSGDRQTAQKYDGQYLQEYSWAEERNGQLYRMLLSEGL